MSAALHLASSWTIKHSFLRRAAPARSPRLHHRPLTRTMATQQTNLDKSTPESVWKEVLGTEEVCNTSQDSLKTPQWSRALKVNDTSFLVVLQNLQYFVHKPAICVAQKIPLALAPLNLLAVHSLF